MEKFENFKAFVQINDAGNGIDIFEAETEVFSTDVLKMSIEEAIDFAKENGKFFYKAPTKEIEEYIKVNMYD